ncbi:MAG: MG2 domain-containing protein [Nitrososphaerota archaeon]
MDRMVTSRILIVCILVSGLVFSPAFAEISAEVGTKIGAEVKVGKEKEQGSSTAEAETKVGAEAKVEAEKKQESSTEEKMKTETSSTSKAEIKTSYPKLSVDSKNSFTIQTDRHLYKAGDEMQIEGTIWSNLILQLGGANLVKIQVTDNKGTVVYSDDATVDSDGKFTAKFTLPVDAQKGAYTIRTNIETGVHTVDTLTLDAKANLQTDTKIVVASSSAHVIKAEGRDFTVKIASNSNVDNVEFKKEEKKVTFRVEGETGTKGVTQVTIPKAMLSGEMMVTIDGKVAASDDVIVTSNTEAETTLEINYHHSIHTIDVVGTNVVPEFSSSLLVMTVAVISVLTLAVARPLLHRL